PTIWRSNVASQRYKRRFCVEHAKLLNSVRLYEELHKGSGNRINKRLTAAIFPIHLVPNTQRQRAGRRHTVEFDKTDLSKTWPVPARSRARHFHNALEHGPVQRLAKIWKRRIVADGGLQMDRETFCEKTIAAWKENVNQFVQNGRFAGNDAGRGKFHISDAA